jgi:hypothetical protein
LARRQVLASGDHFWRRYIACKTSKRNVNMWNALNVSASLVCSASATSAAHKARAHQPFEENGANVGKGKMSRATGSKEFGRKNARGRAGRAGQVSGVEQLTCRTGSAAGFGSGAGVVAPAPKSPERLRGCTETDSLQGSGERVAHVNDRECPAPSERAPAGCRGGEERGRG